MSPSRCTSVVLSLGSEGLAGLMALPHPLSARAASLEARANSTNGTAAVTVRLDRQQDVIGAIQVVLRTATGERRWRVPDTRTIVRVELPDGDVRLRCACRSAWCPEVTIPRPAPVEAQLPVLPGARLRGRWAGLAHEDHIVEILGAWRSPRPSTTTSPLRFVERVSLDPNGQFSVDVPAGVLDLKVNTSGCAPVYRFSIDSRRTGTLGDLRCVMGGAVAGRARDTRTGLVIERARIVVRPAPAQVTAWTAGRHDPTVSPEVVTATDQNGFFQVSALAPGRYRLTIEAPERAPTDTVVDVSAGTETYVDDLWVHPWRSLTIAVEPPQTPDHEPWLLSVRPRDPEARPDTPSVTEARTDEEGLARFDGLRPVEHEIEVRTLGGDTLYLRSHDLPDDDAPLTIAVPVSRWPMPRSR